MVGMEDHCHIFQVQNTHLGSQSEGGSVGTVDGGSCATDKFPPLHETIHIPPERKNKEVQETSVSTCVFLSVVAPEGILFDVGSPNLDIAVFM